MKVREEWTGNLVGKMHNACVTYEELAVEMGVSKAYVSMILQGVRKPAGIQERMEAAFGTIVARKQETT